MAASSASYSILISLSLLSMLVGPSSARQFVSLRYVCSRAADRSLCMRLLRPRTSNSIGDPRGIADVAIGLAHRKAIDISLSGSSHRERECSCSKKYWNAIRDDLEQSKRLLKNGGYRRVADLVNHAEEEARRCGRSLEYKEFEVLCSAAKVCAEVLSRLQ